MSLYQVASSSPSLQCSNACMKTNITDITLDVPCNHTGMTSQAVSHKAQLHQTLKIGWLIGNLL